MTPETKTEYDGFGTKTKLGALIVEHMDISPWSVKSKKREKEVKEEANNAQIPDDEPALLLAKYEKEKGDVMLIDEGKISPKLMLTNTTPVDSNLWYLDNGASNHMT